MNYTYEMTNDHTEQPNRNNAAAFVSALILLIT